MLRGVLLLPEARKSKPPVVIMAHAASATIRMVADKYAESFCRAGLAVLLFDHRNFGSSGGKPRQEINPWVQCRGYRDAIDFVVALDEIDPVRIALWGHGDAGGEVIVVGAIDERVKAIAAQCPVCGSTPPRLESDAVTFEIVKGTLLYGYFTGSPETTLGPIPVVSFDPEGTPSLLKPIQAFRWFIDYGGRPGSRWINRVTRVLPNTRVPYSPVLCAPFIKAPMLMMVAPDDEIADANYAVAKLAFDTMPDPKEWYDIPGGHFGVLYHPSALFDESVRVQTGFFKRCLQGAAESSGGRAEASR